MIFGRLGITLGAKLYYDFTTQDDWDNKVHALVKGNDCIRLFYYIYSLLFFKDT